MSNDKNTAVMALRVIAAIAQKTADDLEKGRLWDGDLAKARGEIQRQLVDAEYRGC